MLLINKKINKQNRTIKGQKFSLNRLWLEGKKLALAGVKIGTAFKIIETDNKLELLFCESDGDRTVSKRNLNNSEVPVIEVNECNSKLIREISDDAILRIVVSPKRISVSINTATLECRVNERETRFLNKLKHGLKLAVGSCFSGGGTFDYMGFKGFQNAGLKTVNRLVIDNNPQAIENLAANVNHTFDDETLMIESDISLLNFSQCMNKLELLRLTPDCKDLSIAGITKKKLLGESPNTASLVYYYSQLVDKSNPAMIQMECVTGYEKSVSFSLFSALLNSFGYVVQTRVIESNAEGFSLENRKRFYVAAISRGLSDIFNIHSFKPDSELPDSLAAVLDDPAVVEESRWLPKIGLLNKEIRDIAAGKGFRMATYDGTEKKVKCIRSQYAKSGSTDPLLKHPDSDRKLFRTFSVTESAAFKGIDVDLVKNVPSSIAHVFLGDGLIGTIAEQFSYSLAKSILSIKLS